MPSHYGKKEGTIIKIMGMPMKHSKGPSMEHSPAKGMQFNLI